MSRRISLATVCLLVLAGVLTTAGPVAAAKPIVISQYRIGFECPSMSDGSSTVALGAFDDEVDGDNGFVEYWVAPDTPETGSGTFRSSSEPALVTPSGYHIDAVIPMENRDFEAVGNAIVSADLIADGDPTTGPGKTRDGNRTIRDRSIEQPLVVESGTLTLFDGRTYDLAGCAGGELTIDIRISNPDQFVISKEGILVACDIAADEYFLNVAASSEESGTGGEFFFASPGATLVGFSDNLTLTSDEFSGIVPMLNAETEEPAGDAVVDVRFLSRERLSLWLTNEEGVRSKFVGWLLHPEGTVTIPTDPATIVDLSTCFAFDGTQQDIQHRPDETPE
jgi:hypothetical protein